MSVRLGRAKGPSVSESGGASGNTAFVSTWAEFKTAVETDGKQFIIRETEFNVADGESLTITSGSVESMGAPIVFEGGFTLGGGRLRLYDDVLLTQATHTFTANSELYFGTLLNAFDTPCVLTIAGTTGSLGVASWTDTIRATNPEDLYIAVQMTGEQDTAFQFTSEIDKSGLTGLIDHQLFLTNSKRGCFRIQCLTGAVVNGLIKGSWNFGIGVGGGGLNSILIEEVTANGNTTIPLSIITYINSGFKFRTQLEVTDPTTSYIVDVWDYDRLQDGADRQFDTTPLTLETASVPPADVIYALSVTRSSASNDLLGYQSVLPAYGRTTASTDPSFASATKKYVDDAIAGVPTGGAPQDSYTATGVSFSQGWWYKIGQFDQVTTNNYAGTAMLVMRVQHQSNSALDQYLAVEVGYSGDGGGIHESTLSVVKAVAYTSGNPTFGTYNIFSKVMIGDSGGVWVQIKPTTSAPNIFNGYVVEKYEDLGANQGSRGMLDLVKVETKQLAQPSLDEEREVSEQVYLLNNTSDHNELQNLNGDSSYQHWTSAEKSNLITSGTADKVWKTDGLGVPDWRDEQGGLGDHGSSYFNASGTTTCTIASTYYQVKSTSTSVSLSDFTMDSATGYLTYTGATTKKFMVSVPISVSSDTNNVVNTWAIAKNGTPITASEIIRKIGTSGDVGTLALTCEVTLAQNDVVAVKVQSDTATNVLTIEKLVLNVFELMNGTSVGGGSTILAQSTFPLASISGNQVLSASIINYMPLYLSADMEANHFDLFVDANNTSAEVIQCAIYNATTLAQVGTGSVSIPAGVTYAGLFTGNFSSTLSLSGDQLYYIVIYRSSGGANPLGRVTTSTTGVNLCFTTAGTSFPATLPTQVFRSSSPLSFWVEVAN